MQLTTGKAFQAFHILRQLSIIAVSIFLARSTLSAATIGGYEMLLFLAFAVSHFWTTGMINGWLSTYPKLEAIAQKRLLFQLYLFFGGLSLFFFLLLYFQENTISQVLLGQTDIPYFQLFSIYLLLHLPTILVEHFYLLKERAWAILGFASLSFGGHLVVLLLPLYLGWDFVWSFYGLIVLAALKHLWLLWVLAQNSTINWQFEQLRPLILLSYPLMLYALFGGFSQVFDSWLVGWYYEDAAQFAIFRYGARELPFALAMAAAFSNSMLPKIAQNMEASLDQLKRKSRLLLHLLFPLAIGSTVISQWVYSSLLSPEFEQSYLVFNIFLLVLLSRLLFPHTVLMGLQENKFIFRISIIELFLNTFVSLLLLPYFGLMGIAMGTVVAYSFEKFAYIIYLQRKHQIACTRYTDLRLWSIYSFILLVCCWWFTF